jgi:hypothetical protein
MSQYIDRIAQAASHGTQDRHYSIAWDSARQRDLNFTRVVEVAMLKFAHTAAHLSFAAF